MMESDSMRKFSKASLKTKFFVSMSSLTSLAVILLIIVIFFVFYIYFMSLQTTGSTNQLASVNNQLSFYLTSMDNYATMIISDDHIQKSVDKYNSSPEGFTEFDRTDLRAEMRKFLQTVPYIHSATVYGLSQDSIATTAIIDHPTLPEEPAPRRGTVYVTGKKYSNYNLGHEIDTLSLLAPFFQISTGAPLGYIEIAITADEIADLYRSGSSDTSRFFIINSQGEVVNTDGSRTLHSTFKPSGDFPGKNSIKNYTSNGSICFLSYISELDWYIVNEIKLTAFFLPLLIILLVSVLISAAVLMISLAASRKISATITKPLYLLIGHIQKVKNGNWSPLNNKPQDLDFRLLFEEFDSMLTSQEKLTRRLVASQEEKDRLALDLLYQQVNPHFLYNTLDNILSLATLDEKEHLIQLVMNLSDFYRRSLSDGNSIITIKDELALTAAYANIMQVRYVNKFTFTVNCPPDLLDFPCLKLLLQPIIENSIYHGIKELDSGGFISVSVHRETDCIIFVIEDNGPGMSGQSAAVLAQPPSGHFGIKNIQRRIRMYYGENGSMSMENTVPHGLRTLIRIPAVKGGVS